MTLKKSIILLLSVFIFASISSAAIKTELAASGLNQPVFVTSPLNDSRLFIVEQLLGEILILESGIISPVPFLDIGSKITAGGERGLLGLVFHPQYPDSGYIYLNYTRAADSATIIARYEVSANPNLIDASSEQILLTVQQPYANHNGGMLAFGPTEGYLYIGMGDGGSGGDPLNMAQDSTELLGKMLRIDINNGLPYSIPQSNPFFGHPTAREEIWALGLRNPWRFSFDRLSGDLYIGDVGQGDIEEIDFQSVNSLGGENYGWRCFEGNSVYTGGGCLPAINYDFPIHEYSHTGGRCSITGGYAYSGCAMPDLHGTYFFGDYCTGQIWSFDYDGAINNFTDRTVELNAGIGISIDNITSFGEDSDGEIYIVDIDGEIYKIVPDGVPSQCAQLCGDLNDDGSVNILDITFYIAWLYQSGPAPNNPGAADVDGNGSYNILDITYLIAYLYQSGPNPNCP